MTSFNFFVAALIALVCALLSGGLQNVISGTVIDFILSALVMTSLFCTLLFFLTGLLLPKSYNIRIYEQRLNQQKENLIKIQLDDSIGEYERAAKVQELMKDMNYNKGRIEELMR